jgi:predicted NBD/HSP70 family sugar kinase
MKGQNVPQADVRRSPGDDDLSSAPAAQPRPRRSDAERHSLAALLNLVRVEGPLTRQELEHRSGLGRAVVASRLAGLAKLGLADEAELGRPSGGRAPRLVQFRADAGLILIAVLDIAKIGVGAADASGRLLIEHHEAADLAAGPVHTLKRLTTLFDWVIEQHRDGRPIWGIGIAAPGPVDVGTGAPFEPTGMDLAPGWNAYPLAEHLASRYGTPVAVHNSVQMRSFGELRAGSGKGSSSLLFVQLGTEISAGLISDGRLHRGAQGAAGMIGHVPVENGSSAVCRCGNTGCLEVVAGAEAIVLEATRAAREERSRYLAESLMQSGAISVADVGLAAQRGDAFSAELLSRCGRQIGSVLAGVANAFNPALIVISGEIAETGDIMLAAIREAIYRSSHPLVTRDLRIVRSQMGDSAGLVGAALTLIDDFFETSFMAEWIAGGSPSRHPEIAALLARSAARIEGGEETQRPPAPHDVRVVREDG